MLETLASLAPESPFTVVSFREDSWEPAFLDDIRGLASELGAGFFEARRVAQIDWPALGIDLMFMVNWRYRVPPAVYKQASLGAYVFHDALLPAYRGFSPTVWAIVNGEERTGATLFRVSEEIDAGDIVDQLAVPIGADDVIDGVTERVTAAYVDLLRRNFAALAGGQATLRPQDEGAATYVCRRTPEDNRIDWREPAERIYNLIRAVGAPYPGAYTTVDGKTLRVWRAARVVDPPRYVGRIPGQIIETGAEGTVVLAGDGAVRLLDVQLDGDPRAVAAHLTVTRTLGH